MKKPPAPVSALNLNAAVLLAVSGFGCLSQDGYAQAKNSGLDEVQRIWKEYGPQRTGALGPAETRFRTGLEQLGRAALRHNDSFTGAEIARQLASPDLPDLSIIEVPKKSLPDFSEFMRLRLEFDRQRDEVDRKLLEWCRTELERAIRAATERNDLAAASVLGQARDAVSKPLFRIVRASYGSGGLRKDVTLFLRKAIVFNRLETNSGKGMGDPAPYRMKDLSITYLVGAKEKHVRFAQGAIVKLP